MRQLLIIFIILIVIVYFQFGEILKENNSFTILQYKNPEKDLLEKILFEKKITIITHLPIMDIIYMNNPIITITPKLYVNLTEKQRTDVLKKLKEFFSYYYLPMNIKSDLSLNYEKRETKTELKIQPNYRFCICQLLGLKKLYLFPPNSKKHIYYNRKMNKCEVDFWNQDITLYPDVVNAKYIEIILSASQAIFIPKGWFFCYEMVDNGMSISFYSESIFSNILK